MLRGPLVFGMGERAPWDYYTQRCPECGEGYLEPDAETYEDPDQSVVICYHCGVEFRLVAIPSGRTTDGTCPDCGSMEMATEDNWTLRCEDCGAHWEIQQISWLARVNNG